MLNIKMQINSFIICTDTKIVDRQNDSLTVSLLIKYTYVHVRTYKYTVMKYKIQHMN